MKIVTLITIINFPWKTAFHLSTLAAIVNYRAIQDDAVHFCNMCAFGELCVFLAKFRILCRL